MQIVQQATGFCSKLLLLIISGIKEWTEQAESVFQKADYAPSRKWSIQEEMEYLFIYLFNKNTSAAASENSFIPVLRLRAPYDIPYGQIHLYTA